MKKLLSIVFALLLLSGCAGMFQKESIFEHTGAPRPDSKKTMYLATSLTGGVSGALDALDISGVGSPNTYDLIDGDSCIVTSLSGANGYSYQYVFDADGTDAEASPTVIRPDDYSTAGVWRLVRINENALPSPLQVDIDLGEATPTASGRLARDSSHNILMGDGTGTLTFSPVIARGTAALGTAQIASGACATVVTETATGALTTDLVGWDFNGDPTAVTGYSPSANGMLTIIAYPTAGNVNFKVCNNTASAITPGAITLNWRVFR